jgi:hypothetical protein
LLGLNIISSEFIIPLTKDTITGNV